MLKNTLEKLKEIINFLLPPRTDFEIVKKLTPRDILNLPKPSHIENDKVIALFDYRDKRVKAIIWELKYKENTKPLETIGKMFFDEIINIISEIILFDANAEFVLIPVPISKQSRIERGFNQSELIAKSIIESDTHRTLLYAPQWLSKMKDTPKQSHSENKDERQKNLIGVFETNDQIEGKYIFVIDDVITTGATTNEIVKTLKEKNIKDVFVLTIAH